MKTNIKTFLIIMTCVIIFAVLFLIVTRIITHKVLAGTLTPTPLQITVDYCGAEKTYNYIALKTELLNVAATNGKMNPCLIGAYVKILNIESSRGKLNIVGTGNFLQKVGNAIKLRDLNL